MKISGYFAECLADSLELPYKNPLFIFSFEGGCFYCSYDAGFDYIKDGFTFEKEWLLV